MAKRSISLSVVLLAFAFAASCSQVEITAVPTRTPTARPTATPQPSLTPTPDDAATADAARYIQTVQAFQTETAAQKATERAAGTEAPAGWGKLDSLSPANAGGIALIGELKTAEVLGASFSPDGRFAVLLLAGETLVVSLEAVETVAVIPGDAFGRTVFHPSGGGFAAGAPDGTLYLGAPPFAELQAAAIHGDVFSALAFTPDGNRLVTASLDGTMRIVDPSTGESLHTIDLAAVFGPESSAGPVQFSPDGENAAVYLANYSAVWMGSADSLLAGDPQGTIISWTDHAGPVASVDIDPAWQILAWISRATLQLMSIDGTPVGEPHGHLDWLFNPTFVPSLELLLVTTTETDGGAASGVVIAYEYETGEQVYLLAADEPISAFAVSEDGQIAVSGHYDGTIRAWDLATGMQIDEVSLFQTPIQQVLITPDRLLLAATDGESGIKLVGLEDGEVVAELAREPGSFIWIAFDSGGRVLTTAGSTGELWLYGVMP